MTSVLINAFKRLNLSIRPQVKVISSSYSTAVTTANSLNVTQKEWKYPPLYTKPREVWIENLDTVEEKKLGLFELHPSVYAAMPRIDIIHRNFVWQTKYRWVSWAHTKTRAEVRGGGRKPWPQKGLGRARHGSIRSPLWRGGGVAHGPRSGKTHFFMLPFHLRIHGLTSMLSAKLAQDDLHVVNNLELPTDESNYLADLIENRNWGPSVLIIDDTDIAPRNITVATDSLPHVNIMPVYGLNVYSMLKHDTLVLTLAAAERIEERILHHLNAITTEQQREFKLSQV
ncbi:PREDICTED: 39S ribosomal protein L4, mitochondrial [Papilio xuthus]|uniref:Large ribosomal subunit protein uL4m n=1 Tax=Papilio xuthus TaxID=66420 RepID=A0A194PU14_PAPXU|nr:PREDICTED: 39S ribosomal protein L4, mitochondrial [Papilio xuthus]KPI96807.1 39S ribosomal protein L4, mitochondrial [Papilio xuthus]